MLVHQDSYLLPVANLFHAPIFIGVLKIVLVLHTVFVFAMGFLNSVRACSLRDHLQTRHFISVQINLG